MTTSAILAVRFDSVPMPAHRFILLVYPFSWLDSIQFYLIPSHSWPNAIPCANRIDTELA